MTMILIDGFDHADVTDVWTLGTDLGNVSTTNPRTGTRRYLVPTNASFYRALSPSEVDDGVTLGFAFNAGSANPGDYCYTADFNESGPSHLSIGIYNISRSIRINRGDVIAGGGTLLAESDVNLWTYDTWNYLEVGVKIANTGGVVEVRLNGVTIVTYAGDTQNGGTGVVDQVGFTGSGASQTKLLDDVYILNEQGSAPWNSFLGDTRCYPLYPSGNGNYSQLDGSDGNSTDNYLLVDEAGTPSSSDYVGSVTNGEIDTYAFQDISAVQTIGTIYAVESRIYAAKSETGTKQMRLVVRRSATDATGPDHILAENSYATYRYIMQLDPHAGPGAWTISNVDATEFGAEIRP